MKLRGLFILLLVLAILLPVSSIFQSASVPYAAFSGTGQNVVVVAKEDYVFARVVINIEPFVNGSNVVVNGGSILPTAITFPNGTTRQVPVATTFVLTLPNSAVLPFSGYSASGPGYRVSPATPVSAQILEGQNSTTGLDLPPGIHVYQYVVTGDAEVTVQVLGMSV